MLGSGNGDRSVSMLATVAVRFALNLSRLNSSGLAIGTLFSSGVSTFSTSTVLICAMTASSCCWATSPARPLPVIALGASLAPVRPVLLDQRAERLAAGGNRLAPHSHIEQRLGDGFVASRRAKIGAEKKAAPGRDPGSPCRTNTITAYQAGVFAASSSSSPKRHTRAVRAFLVPFEPIAVVACVVLTHHCLSFRSMDSITRK